MLAFLKRFFSRRVSTTVVRRQRARPGVERLESRLVMSASSPDFNGDGIGDLAFGNPEAPVNGLAAAGAVHVIYGSTATSGSTLTGGLAGGSFIWNQNGSADGPEVADDVGLAVTWGDFNRDGYDDLAVAAPGEDVNGMRDAGRVDILYGSSSGLRSQSQIWTQDSAGILDFAETGDRFGSSLTTGDFNGDGFADLAVGIGEEDLYGIVNAGAVQILYGSASGVLAYGNQIFSQSSAVVPFVNLQVLDAAESDDRFGATLAAGDFNGDGRTDLAVGVMLEDIGALINAGAVNVIYGSASGLTTSGNQLWTQDSVGVADTAEAGDWFGASLAAGDFNGDGRADLAIGVPLEDLSIRSVFNFVLVDAGAVNVLYGSASGLNATANQFWTQDSYSFTLRGRIDILDQAESYDQFGYSLVAGDFNGDGRADLAVGVPYEDIGFVNAGAVNVIYGSTAGLTITGNQFWTQDSINRGAGTGDLFGWALGTLDFNGDGRTDLAVGVPFESFGGSIQDAGELDIIFGSTSGLNATVRRSFNHSSPTPGGHYAWSLARR